MRMLVVEMYNVNVIKSKSIVTEILPSSKSQ